MSRTFERRCLWRLDQPTFHAAARLLAQAVVEHAGRADGGVDLVIGVARGGRALAETLAASLGVPVCMIGARHNLTDARYVQGHGHVEIELASAVAAGGAAVGARCLVTDDICGTGATLQAVTGELERLAPASIRSCTLCRNEGSSLLPDWWVWDVRDWVVFPWEPPPPNDVATVPLPTPTRIRMRQRW